MKKNLILCVDITTRLQQDACLRMGKNYKGVLSVKKVNEHLEFVEQAVKPRKRNTPVWRGKYINIHRDDQGNHLLYFRRIVLDAKLDPCNFADEVFLEVEQAKVELGL